MASTDNSFEALCYKSERERDGEEALEGCRVKRGLFEGWKIFHHICMLIGMKQ